MQGRVSRVEGDSSSCAAPIAETRAALAALEEQKARLVEDVQRLKRGKEVSQAALHALTQQIAAIKQAKATLNSDHGSNVPRVRCVAAGGGAAVHCRAAVRRRRDDSTPLAPRAPPSPAGIRCPSTPPSRASAGTTTRTRWPDVSKKKCARGCHTLSATAAAPW